VPGIVAILFPESPTSMPRNNSVEDVAYQVTGNLPLSTYTETCTSSSVIPFAGVSNSVVVKHMQMAIASGLMEASYFPHSTEQHISVPLNITLAFN